MPPGPDFSIQGNKLPPDTAVFLSWQRRALHVSGRVPSCLIELAQLQTGGWTERRVHLTLRAGSFLRAATTGGETQFSTQLLLLDQETGG